MSSTPQVQECCICLQPAQTRNGFEFLTTPGCCGKWFHQSCLSAYINSGGRDCPHCRATFPAGAIQAAGAAAAVPTPPAVSIFGAPQIPNHAQALFPPPPPIRNVNNLFGGGNLNNYVHARPVTRPSAPLPLDASYRVEDPLVVVETPVATESNPKQAKQSGDSHPASPLQVTMTPEYPVEGLAANGNFHVRVSLQYNELAETEAAVAETEATARNPLDIVCVVDNSGSMQGEKIENLKKAIEFVVSVMDAKDRLSIVTFNSSASLVMHFKSMTGEMKGKVRTEVLPSIRANGGTDIYDGIRVGYQTLKDRQRGRNENSIMFLLTDGQDRSRLAEKQRMVREMRAEYGTGLFVFGFGADHDSAHMTEIANTCEGSFIYIDTNDTVIDAFGGAIGSQQGQVLRNIEVDVHALSDLIKIQTIQSGSYQHTIESERMRGKVKFSDLFQGEKRDFLIALSLPAVESENLNYALMAGVATYSLSAGSSTDPSVARERVASSCAIQRLDATNPNLTTLRQRDLLVDADIYRMRCTEAIANSISHADRHNFDQAKKVLEDSKQALVNESLAYRAGDNAVLRSMFTDLQDCMQRTTSRQAYERDGGRATMSEHFDGHSKQRRVFSKPCMGESHVSPYQTISSSRQQTAACYSKAPTPVVSSSIVQPSQPATSSILQNIRKTSADSNTKAYCMHMGKTGTCPYGSMCHFSHTLPPCTYFQKGKCTKTNCPFPHVLSAGTDADGAAKPAAQPIELEVLPAVPEELMRYMGISSTAATGDSSTSQDTSAVNKKKEEQQKKEDKDKK